MKPLNILYIHSHDTGRYIQPYGYAVPTPNLQCLAEEGVLFRQAFCAAPTCSPSRAALLTGQCAHSAGMLGLAHRNFGFALNDYSRHIIHTLHAAGYHSALSGVQHVAKDKNVIGYSEILPFETEGIAEAAVAFLERQSPASQPFFLDVGFSETHRAFPEAAPEDDPRWCLSPAPLPDTPETRADMAAYKTSARLLDKRIGQVLETLERTGLAENTLVICTTDHGIAFPAMKCNLTNHGIGVMLMMRGPEHFSGGKVLDALVSQMDLFPTVCELLQIEPPLWLQGKSLLPLLRGETGHIHEAIFAENNFHGSFEPERAVRTARWKYIRRFDERRTPVVMHCDASISKDLWLKQGWAQQPVENEQLYDLMFDPNETHNRAADPALASVLAEMRERLDRWMRETDDPLLRDVFAVPANAELHHPDYSSLAEAPVQDPQQLVNSILGR